MYLKKRVNLHVRIATVSLPQVEASAVCRCCVSLAVAMLCHSLLLAKSAPACRQLLDTGAV